MQRDSFFDDVDLAGLPAAEQLLAELGANLPVDAVADDGVGQSCPIHLIVKVEAGSASGRTAEPMFVKLQRITPHTAIAVAEQPLRAGDLYRLDFTRLKPDLPLTYAVCRKVQVLQEDRYEVAFQFFATIDVPPGLLQAHAAR